MTDIKQFGVTGNAMTKASVKPAIDKNTLKYYSGHGVANEDYVLRVRCESEGTKEIGEIGIDITGLFESVYVAPILSANWTKKETPSPLAASAVQVAATNPTFDPGKPLERVATLYFYEGEVEGSFTILYDPYTSGSAATHLNANFVPAGATDHGHLKFVTVAEKVIDSASPVAPLLTLTIPVGATITFMGEEQARGDFRKATFNFNFHLTQSDADQTKHIVALDSSIFASTDIQAIAKLGAPLVPDTDLYSVEQTVNLDGVNKFGTMTQKIAYYDSAYHYLAA